jgi:hypothetical protein
MKEEKTMDRKWSEKTTLEKVMDILAGIGLCVWIVFEILSEKTSLAFADTASSIAIALVCVFEAVSYWNVKRVFSYVAIAGAILIMATTILLIL